MVPFLERYNQMLTMSDASYTTEHKKERWASGACLPTLHFNEQMSNESIMHTPEVEEF